MEYIVLYVDYKTNPAVFVMIDIKVSRYDLFLLINIINISCANQQEDNLIALIQHVTDLHCCVICKLINFTKMGTSLYSTDIDFHCWLLAV